MRRLERASRQLPRWIECDCGAEDLCPQGRPPGSIRRCFVKKNPQPPEGFVRSLFPALVCGASAGLVAVTVLAALFLS